MNAINLQEEYAKTEIAKLLNLLDEELVGLAPVKARIREIAALLLIDKLRKNLGITTNSPGLHMSFTGSPGTGKTTLARIIVNDILKCNYLYINASDESGIDTIRHNITNFAQTKSFDGNVKVVVLELFPTQKASEIEVIEYVLFVFSLKE